MNNTENEDNEIISGGYPEKTPGTFQSYNEISDYLEYSSNALDALGDLMVCVKEEQLNEFTVQGIGFLLKMLGNDVINKSYEVSEIAWKIPKEQRQNESANSQVNIEAS